MSESGSMLIGLIVLVVIILLIVWVVNNNNDSNNNGNNGNGNNGNNNNSNGNCARTDPVGNVKTVQSAPGEITISWDAPSNATSYKVFINSCDESECHPVQNGKKNSKKVSSQAQLAHGGRGPCGDSSCCPQEECESCVSQSNYKEVVSTSDTSIVVQTCEPCFCYLIVPYNACGEAGPCKQVRYASLECNLAPPSAWLVKNDCNGLEIGWECSPCCDAVEVYVGCQLVATVPCCETSWTGPQVPCGVEVSIRCINERCNSCYVEVIKGESRCPNFNYCDCPVSNGRVVKVASNNKTRSGKSQNRTGRR